MDIRLRLLPAAVVAILVIGKVLHPGFLDTRPFDAIPVTWFWLILIPALYLAAWALSAAFARLVVTVARNWFLPPVFFVALAAGAIWAVDTTWNHLLADPFGWPRSSILSTITEAIFGSPDSGGTSA